MPKYDDRTLRGWALPHRQNKLSDDADRLRETLTTIDADLTKIENDLQGVTDVNEFLSTRMEVIVGEATNDTEILDARVDAEGIVHPNLGHNVRNIHSGVLQTISDIKYGVQEFQGLLHQFSAIAEAQIQGELNAQDAYERRKVEIQQEALTRLLQDNDLQKQINEASEAALYIDANLHELAERLRAKIKNEETARISSDANLQSEIDALAESFLTDVLNLQDVLNRQNEALKQAIRAGVDEAVAVHDNDINAEVKERADGDKGLARQANDNAEATLRAVLNFQEANARRKADLAYEVKERTWHDKHLQKQVDDTATASLENALLIQNEAEQRREINENLNAEILQINEHDIQQDEEISLQKREIAQERQIRSEQDEGLQREADLNAETNIRTALNQYEADERRKADLSFEKQERIARDAVLQKQIDETAAASLENALGIHQEAEQRRKSDERIEALKDESGRQNEADAYHQYQIDNAIQAILQNALALSEALANSRKAQSEERQNRFDEDARLQAQQDTNSAAILELAVNLSSEAEKRRELRQALAGIKSPVDWSKSSSLAISEPRCAVVNFTGLNAMPTTKTADIPAFMEFWDMQGNYFKKPIVCSAQGSSSLGYIKKNVKFDLLNDDGSEFDLKIGNWVAQDGFHLKAYYTDFFRGVAVTSYKFWDEIMRFNGLNNDRPYKRALMDMESIRTSGTSLNNPDDLTLQLDTGALCHPDGFPCIVYLNGIFYGIYSWQIKKQRKNYHMDKSTVEHIHLDGSLYTQYFWNGAINWTTFEIRNPNKLYTMDGKKYDGDAPKELIDETSEAYNLDDKNHVRSAKVKKYIQGFVQSFGELKNLYTAYRANPSDENLSAVKAKYEELFDWENMRDYLIFSDIIKNSDGFGKNWQWTTYDGVKWFVNAYDLDMSYGGHWQGIQITAPLTGHITTSTALPVYYVALLYKPELEARYRELRDAGIISVNNILSKLTDWTARIGVSNYELEYERWPNSPCILNYTDSIYRVKRWLEVEIANMDKVYNYNLEDETPQPDATETETQIRADEIAGMAKQVDTLAYASMESELNRSETNAERRREEAQERYIRDEQDAGLQAQIDKLAEADMWMLLKEHDNHQRINQSIAETPGRFASDDEVDSTLGRVFDDE